MIYSEARPKVRSGDLLLFKGTGLVSEIIRDCIVYPYSHVALAWRVGGRILVIESRPSHRGVTIDRTLSQAIKQDEVAWLPTYVPWDKTYEERAFKSLGAQYSFLNAIESGLKIPMTGKGYECAQFVIKVLALPSNGIETPQTAADRFRDHPLYQLELA